MIKDLGKGRAPLRGAIIGLGNVAIHAHLPVWQRSEDFTIEAIVEPTPERAELGRRLLPEARIYPTMDALLSENSVDFVDICTPPCFHAELVLAACSSGLHVLCEKPLSISTERLRDIERLAKQTQRVVFTVNNWKYAPLWLKATELIRDNQLGAIQSIDLNVLRSVNSGGGASDWRKCLEIAQGGILIDHGWHNLYLILSLLQEFPLSMAVKMESSAGSSPGLEETVDLVMRFCEAETHLHLTWQASCRRNYGTIVGNEGSLFINDDHLIFHSGDSPPVRFDFSEALSAGSHHPEWMVPVVKNFSREIEEIHYRGTNLMETRWCSHLIDLAYRSHRDAIGIIDVCSPFLETFDS
jgi:predicted dehydrogenase